MEFVNGVEAPKLEEVGPFVIKDGVSKKQNVTFSEDGSEVGFVETLCGPAEGDRKRVGERGMARVSLLKYTFRFVLFFLQSNLIRTNLVFLTVYRLYQSTRHTCK